ncbi:hypothetical protein [Actinomadura sp. B10D3]|uniref:tetratricopeptide repeat protein n=1 Tax=Actinomadura sp. B10D3 TaxID=3153557 RepID=UPI00325E2E54
MSESEDATAAYAAALRALHEAAGSPTGQTIQRQAKAQRPPLTVSTSSWGEWRNGVRVPSKKPVADFLIAYLRNRAKEKTPNYAAPPGKWWEQTRLRALAQRRTGKGKGGRPARTHPPLEPVNNDQGRPIDQWDPVKLGQPVAELDPVRALEVHPAIEPRSGHGRSDNALPLYVKRDHDDLLRNEVDQASAGSRLVVLVADSSTGKTRALWEAVQQLPEGWFVWRPADRAALLRGLASYPDLGRTVLWLNETQRYLYTPDVPTHGEEVAAALTDVLNRPDRGPVLILGTLWRDTHALLAAPSADSTLEGDLHQHARALLRTATILSVAETFDQAALDDLRRLAEDDPRLAEALAHGGNRITQYLAGARELLHRYIHAPAEARALLDAAADARRLGIGEALPEAFLRAAAAAYLDPDDWQTQTDTWRATWFTRATNYTSWPCRGVPGPLTPIVPLPGQAAPIPTEAVYRMADYLHQHTAAIRRYQSPPAGFWDAAADHLHRSPELAALAESARVRRRLRHADRLFRAAAIDTRPLELLGRMREAEDWIGTELMYCAAVGDTNALREIALSRQRAGDLEGAERLYSAAAQADILMPSRLGQLPEIAGERQRAEHLFSGARDVHAALFKLAQMREWAGDPEGAERLWRGAADAGDAFGHFMLAKMRERAGDLAEAEQLYRAAADATDADEAWSALFDLAQLRERAGDLAEAEQLYCAAADAGDLRAPSGLSQMWERTGDRERAESIAQEAAKAGNPYALFDLAQLRQRAGDLKGVEQLFRAAAKAGYVRALSELAVMHEAAGDQVSAERLAQQAVDAGNAYALYHLSLQWDEARRDRFQRFGLTADGSLAEPWW